MEQQGVVITGASTGIGADCALTLERLGYRVFAGVRKPSDGNALKALAGPRLTPLLLDVTDAASIAALDKASYGVAEKLMNSTLQDALKDKKLSDVK